MKKDLIRIAALLLVLGALSASFWAGRELARREGLRPVGAPDTVFRTVWVHDTVKQYVTKPAGVRYIYLNVHDTTTVHDTTIVADPVLVEVPIEERTYEGENYRATVRGFEPELTDIWIKRTEHIITMPYRKRWGVTVGPQAGVGITPEGWRPYAGVGVTFGYNF